MLENKCYITENLKYFIFVETIFDNIILFEIC